MVISLSMWWPLRWPKSPGPGCKMGALAESAAPPVSCCRTTTPLLMVKFFFQLAFAATIVSGCVAERIHYQSYMVFVVLLVGLSYPISGHWVWGGGWLANLGFRDFARGSTVVHSVGG